MFQEVQVVAKITSWGEGDKGNCELIYQAKNTGASEISNWKIRIILLGSDIVYTYGGVN